ncbi:Cell cycle control protein, putative [Trichomonas vaginalis G3]|uniref:Cell cycle control protein, putative n=1 Tax=Trichomonas vaginalis (strain ATCC PRA-98 / G3) TaxID=412133 RepID=A2FUP7_TRIV3|nr:RNA splicing [Trichomonas vaginalis G3]EAX91364.1 Cell cycle control protein, putative [Trichomonas vaginalis G3]KAI5520089.1 RNA splicing [Trichomonas vaginalis G3]|eukprot:XP_001304294.1 Cell cycle control protein [Trichomonas vaginalis G3]
MYNGVGVRTPRGTGTSGHVQDSLAVINYDKKIKPKPLNNSFQKSDALKDHESRVKIETECYLLRKKLREQNIPEDQIKTRVDKFREEQLEKLYPKKKLDINTSDSKA